jgi:hypothetical protein
MGNFLNLVYDEVDVTKENIITYFDVYVRMDNYKVFNINEIPNDGSKYYYFYEYRYYLASFIMTEKKIPLSETVINLLKNDGNFNLILINDAESDDDVLIEHLDNLFKSMGIDTNKIVVINCNESNHDLKKKLNSNIITHSTNNGKWAYANEMTRFPYQYEENRNFLFMTYNRHVKEHRFALLVHLMKHNILDNIDWSWIRGYQVNEHNLINNENLNNSMFLKKLFTTDEIENFRKEIIKLADIQVKKSVYELDYQVDYPPYRFDTEASYSNNPYKNSYINIVTETNFDKNDIILTSEKSFIPLFFSQIPIIMASTNHIKKIKDRYGFDFFDDVVNHTYDSEPNPKKRFEMIIDEILRLNSKKEEIITFFKHNKSRFDRNVQIFEEMKKDKTDYNFYKSLI